MFPISTTRDARATSRQVTASGTIFLKQVKTKLLITFHWLASAYHCATSVLVPLNTCRSTPYHLTNLPPPFCRLQAQRGTMTVVPGLGKPGKREEINYSYQIKLFLLIVRKQKNVVEINQPFDDSCSTASVGHQHSLTH